MYGGNCPGWIFLPVQCHFFKTLMADFDQVLHSHTLFNWLPWSTMSAALGKSKFWTRHLRFSTWKPPVNMGNSRFSTTFSSFDNLFFVLEIVWKPSVTFPLCLSHVRKLLVTLPLPFFMNCLQEQCKIWVRAAPSRGRFWHQWQCTHPPTVIIRFFERTAINVLKKWHRNIVSRISILSSESYSQGPTILIRLAISSSVNKSILYGQMDTI